MKLLLLITFGLFITNAVKAEDYVGSRSADVWNTVAGTPYSQLPKDEVGYKSLFDGAVSLIERSATRTLNNHNDILPYFTKLAHPNGVCLKGEWKITSKNPYTGLFKNGTRAIIIARASVALNDTEEGKFRGFGLAGKLFPTLKEDELVKTANFFLIDDLGGTKAAHYTDVEMTNEPKVSKTSTVFKYFKYVLKVASTFKKVDGHPTMRQVYVISELTKPEGEKLVNPKWMMVKASKKQLKVNEADFRNELNINSNNGSLLFEIYAADSESNNKKNWSQLGEIEFTESIAAEGCDHQLHFHHPKWRSDLE